MKVINKIIYDEIYDDTRTGQAYWYVIHTFATLYPSEPTATDRATWSAFYTLLVNMMPCGNCRTVYSGFVDRHPIENHLKNPFDLYHWTFLLHNKVNESLNKVFTPSVRESFRMYYSIKFDHDKFVQFLLLLAINYDVFVNNIDVSESTYLQFIKCCLSIVPESSAEQIEKVLFPLTFTSEKRLLIKKVVACFDNRWIWFQKYVKVYHTRDHKYRCNLCISDCCKKSSGASSPS